MNLSKRQIELQNKVLLETNLLKDLCQIVAQYVFARAFEMKLKKTMQVKLGRSLRKTEWYLVKRDQKEFLVLRNADVDLTSGEITERAVYPYFSDGGWMDGKRWSSSVSGVFCNSVMIHSWHNYIASRWLGCDEEWKEVYFMTIDGWIYTINEKGLRSSSCLVYPRLSEFLYQNPEQCVIKKRKLWMWCDEHMRSARLVMMKLEQQDTLYFSGFVDIYSSETMQFLRKEFMNKNLCFKWVQIEKSLYAVEKRKDQTLEISVFE